METSAYMVGLLKLQAPERVKDGLILIQPKGSVKPYYLFKNSHKQMLREEYKHYVFYSHFFIFQVFFIFNLQLFSTRELP